MKELFLDKSLVTNPNVTGELVLVYIALRKVMSDEVPLFSKETSVGIVSLNKMAFVLKTICEEWLNYANFRIWFDEHYVPGKWQIDLDKELLVQGNKEYSPETCVFLEHYQNTMFEHNAKDMIYENEDGTFFIGKGRKKTYATYEEAVDIICGRNKKRIENEIEKSLGKIPMCAHEAMLKWDVRAAV